MKNLITGAMIASLIISAALNVAQYNGWLAAPEQFVSAGVPADCNNAADPINCLMAQAGR